ncbi:hypothetical protein K435DRAFT_677793, partial [Dendrothele bispora CBS 962.96]
MGEKTKQKNEPPRAPPQRGTASNVCFHPHEIRNITSKLPRPFDSLYDEIAVVFVSNDNSVSADAFEHTPFLVRREKILAALLWLKANNRYYFDIEIDMEALNEYPAAGSVGHRPPMPVHLQKPDDTIFDQGLHCPVVSYNGTNTILFIDISLGTFDLDNATSNYHIRKLDALRKIKNGHPFLKTSSSHETISPRDHPHVYAWLWPTLFPYGVGFPEDHIR